MIRPGGKAVQVHDRPIRTGRPLGLNSARPADVWMVVPSPTAGLSRGVWM
jgi:hypothetical protein